jgi:hypothetical protein
MNELNSNREKRSSRRVWIVALAALALATGSNAQWFGH